MPTRACRGGLVNHLGREFRRPGLNHSPLHRGEIPMIDEFQRSDWFLPPQAWPQWMPSALWNSGFASPSSSQVPARIAFDWEEGPNGGRIGWPNPLWNRGNSYWSGVHQFQAGRQRQWRTSRGPATAGGTTVVRSGARQPGRGEAAVVATAKPLRASAHISVHAADRRLACKQSLLAKDGRASWHEFRNACVCPCRRRIMIRLSGPQTVRSDQFSQKTGGKKE